MLALLRTREKSLRPRHCVTGDALRGSSWRAFWRECVVVGMRSARIPEYSVHSDEPVAALASRMS